MRAANPILVHATRRQRDVAVDSKVPIYTLALSDLNDESMSLVTDNG